MARRRSGERTVSVDGFAAAIEGLFEEYVDEVNEGVKDAVQKGGKTVTKEIKATSAFIDRTGGYRDGWRQKTEGSLDTGYTSTVYNASKPGLAHLLEKGHGGPAPAPPHPHIAPAYEEGVRVFESELKKAF